MSDGNIQEAYRFIVPGPAVAQARPRLTTWGGMAHAYEPKKSRDYKSYVRECATGQGAPDEPLSGPLSLLVTEYRAIPASWAKWKRQAANEGDISPMTKPDWDNIGKAISDALNGLIWKDDAQVIDGHVRKFYDTEPRVEIEVRKLGTE